MKLHMIVSVTAFLPCMFAWSYVASLPTDIGWMGVAAVNSTVFVTGGSVSGGRYISDVLSLPPFAGVWMAAPAMPTSYGERNHLATVAYQDQVYVIGGFNEEPLPACSSMLAFNGVNWSSAPGLTTCRSYHAAATCNGRIFVMGGLVSPLVENRTVESFAGAGVDPSGWVRDTDSLMPTPRMKFAAVEYNGMLYLIGGCSSDLQEAFCAQGSTANVDIYSCPLNGMGGQWSTAPPMRTARGGHAAAVFNNQIYVVGGNDQNGNYLNTVEIFNGQSWTTGPPMLTARAGFGLIVSNIPYGGKNISQMYAIGGFTASKLPGFTPLSTVEMLSTSDDATLTV